MSDLFNQAMQAASEDVNTVLGAACVYHRINGDSVKNVHIVIDKNQPVQTDYGVIAGYRVEASILKSEIPLIKVHDSFTDENDVTWRVNALVKETSSKWYVDVIQL